MTEDDKKLAAVYVSWITMKSALDQLSQGIHSKIDRSVFPGIAWSIQSQLFTGMRFLGLITDDSDPTPLLEDLVTGTEEERKRKLGSILKTRYAALFALDLTKTTPQQLSQKMGELYQVTGETRERAVRFFLGAVDYAAIPISPLFKKGRRNGSPSVPGKRRGPRIKRDQNTEVADSQVGAETKATGTSKSVALRSGGTLTISATLDLFALNMADRKFVFDLIDKLDDYEQASA